MSLSLVTMETSRPFFARLLGQRADHVVGLKAVEFENRQPHGFAHPPHVGQLHGEILGHRRALRLVLVKKLVAKRGFPRVEHHGEIIRRMLLRQLAQHVREQVGNLRGNALRAVQPRHGRKVGAKDESHRVDKEEFFRERRLLPSRASIAKRRVPPGCAILSVRGFSRRLTRTRSQCPNAPKKTREAVAVSIAAAANATQTRPDCTPDLKKPTIAEIFGPGGAIEKCMPEGYEHRPSQLEMAELVEAAFQEKRHLIVEAGTGTGKTLAYLIPAIRSGRRVVISTATKSLQEQLFEKDIPFLQKHFAPESESGRDEGARQFSVPRKSLPHGRPARAEGSRRSWTGSRRFATGKKSRRRATARNSIFCPTIRICGSGSTRAATPAPVQNARSSTGVSSRRCTSAPPRPT